MIITLKGNTSHGKQISSAAAESSYSFYHIYWLSLRDEHFHPEGTICLRLVSGCGGTAAVCQHEYDDWKQKEELRMGLFDRKETQEEVVKRLAGNAGNIIAMLKDVLSWTSRLTPPSLSGSLFREILIYWPLKVLFCLSVMVGWPSPAGMWSNHLLLSHTRCSITVAPRFSILSN